MENLAGIQHAQCSRRAVPGAERVRPARPEPDEDRIPPAARQAMGVSVLSGLPGPGGFASGAKRSESSAGDCGLPACAGVLSEGLVVRSGRLFTAENTEARRT